jgi:hypothetical protein
MTMEQKSTRWKNGANCEGWFWDWKIFEFLSETNVKFAWLLRKYAKKNGNV